MKTCKDVTTSRAIDRFVPPSRPSLKQRGIYGELNKHMTRNLTHRFALDVRQMVPVENLYDSTYISSVSIPSRFGKA